MKSFIIACTTTVIIALIFGLVLNSIQEPTRLLRLQRRA